MEKVCGLFMQAVAEHFDKCLVLQQDIREEVYDWYFKIDALERELEYVKGQLEDANNELNLTRLRLENLKKYGAEVPDIRDMYPCMDEHAKRYAKQHLNEIYGKDITEGDRLDPADYADLPFPDLEDVAPAEEVEGANE